MWSGCVGNENACQDYVYQRAGRRGLGRLQNTCASDFLWKHMFRRRGTTEISPSFLVGPRDQRYPHRSSRTTQLFLRKERPIQVVCVHGQGVAAARRTIGVTGGIKQMPSAPPISIVGWGSFLAHISTDIHMFRVPSLSRFKPAPARSLACSDGEKPRRPGPR